MYCRAGLQAENENTRRFPAWLTKHFALSPRAAARYMRYSERVEAAHYNRIEP